VSPPPEDLPLIRGCFFCDASVRVDEDRFCSKCGLAIVPKTTLSFEIVDGKVIMKASLDPLTPKGKDEPPA